MAYELPTEKTSPVEDLEKFLILIYGQQKVGKTSLASHADDPLFLMCEPGSKGLTIFERAVKSWKDFRAYVKMLTSQSHEFRTVVVDTVDLAYDMCMDYVCMKRGIEHPTDEGYGKAWKAVKSEFVRQINKLAHSGLGVIFISHDVAREVKGRSGAKYDRIQPTMAGQARDVMEAIVDIWVHYSFTSGGKRQLQIVGDEIVSAGHRLEQKFLYKDSTKPVRMISAGSTSQEAWNNFVRGFNNRLPLPAAKKKRKAKED